jgi:putative acetyltransferase
MAVRIRKRRPDETERLYAIWHAAVAATHNFLSPEDFRTIAGLVRDHYLPEADLWVAAGEGDEALAFLGMTGAKVDALFVDPARHGQGVGRALMAHAGTLAGPLSMDVNEQNPGALAFYRRLGFAVAGRSETDESGMPYPLLHLVAAPDTAAS